MRSVVYSGFMVPPEWVAAHGLRPVRLVPEPAPSSLMGETAGVCHYMHAFFEEASSSDAAGVVATTFCDQMRRGVEAVEPDSAVPRFLLHAPRAVESTAAARYYAEELRRLSRFLTQLGGTLPSDAELVRTMRRYDEARRTLLDARPRLSGSDFARRLRDLYSGEPDLPSMPEAPFSEGVPVAVLGGPLTVRDEGLLRLIQEAGGRIVLDGTENGERTLPLPFSRRRLIEDPLSELCDAYLAIPDVGWRPNHGLFVWLRDHIAARGVRGVVLLRNVWCDLWHAEVARLREWLPVPLLDIDLDGEPAVGRNRTRVQAFMEAL